jgi:hypothetical protein
VKNLTFCLLTGLFLAAVSSTWAQSGSAPDTSNDNPHTQVDRARSAYTDTDTLPVVPNPSLSVPEPGSETAQAQFPGRIPRPPLAPRGPMPYPRYGYPSPWMSEGHPGHALIGVLIGGTLGATLGANAHPNGQTGPNVVGALFLGGLGAAVGGLIGNSFPWSPHRFRRDSWPDDDESASRSRPKQAGSARQVALAKAEARESKAGTRRAPLP